MIAKSGAVACRPIEGPPTPRPAIGVTADVRFHWTGMGPDDAADYEPPVRRTEPHAIDLHLPRHLRGGGAEPSPDHRRRRDRRIGLRRLLRPGARRPGGE